MLGRKIKEARLKKGYTQTELGNLVGVTKEAICRYEKGLINPKMKVFEKLVICLDLTLDYTVVRKVDSVNENKEEYFKLNDDDIKIIEQLKKYPNLYYEICMDIPNKINAINKIMKK